MTKRKREFFTVIESVSNWFEASNEVVIEPDNDRDVANCPDLEVAHQASLDDHLTTWRANGAIEDPHSDVSAGTDDGLLTPVSPVSEPVGQLGLKLVGQGRAGLA